MITDCRHLRTKRETFAVFARWPSPRVIAAGLLALLILRVILGAWSWWDLVAVGIVVGLTPFTEWFIHLFVLHADPIMVRGHAIDTGAGHRQHHLDPGRIENVLLRGVDAAVFQPMIGGLVIAVTVPVLWLADAPMLAPTVTALVAAVAKLLEYEWDHLLFHTAYRPRTPYYARLKRNHRLHHWRNERYWLGVTVNLGDRVLRTYPKSKSDVPLSPTARTLGTDPEG